MNSQQWLALCTYHDGVSVDISKSQKLASDEVSLKARKPRRLEPQKEITAPLRS